MGTIRSHISISLDGYIAGPDQTLPEPLGVDGERLHDWAISSARSDWGGAAAEEARRSAARAGGSTEDFDLDTSFLHDVPASVAAQLLEHDHDEAEIAFTQPCPFRAWPAVPTTVLAGRDDRLFPLALQRRIARKRLGLDVVELPGGHLNALSEPEAVTATLLSCATAARRAALPG